ncbi:hypothetical protein [Amaricoccus macauensis]|uniref:hypothetical protein n=1 Tax=Amaricoccus macauensis TaxID=57001 RepID=UPI003C7BA2A8
MTGNAQTLLPEEPAPDTNQPFSRPSCWAEPPGFLNFLLKRMAGKIVEFRSADQIRADLLCHSGQDPPPTGTPCALDLTREACLDPAANPHHPQAIGPAYPITGRF